MSFWLFTLLDKQIEDTILKNVEYKHNFTKVISTIDNHNEDWYEAVDIEEGVPPEYRAGAYDPDGDRIYQKVIFPELKKSLGY